ncbi:DNA helicase-2 / ATP-dependent DNA helicase PcrA [Plantibacter flavus]|uniref:DNA 3'-5' helicase n=1 Tax=Plantibacter flavus TaxID=150123 RepID=A0A3N2BLC4_9MICO|nr:ATP-dependent helicase [Plantibacter flavus]ROR76008.1 DNA helicase-2/ATP-dependent DNA helicase PcrA [Plantibacter flavus]SMG49357.1 DNA helicase-2 / ATP-dependent DNA helicase PcrA [Plantibacter flavus]
MPIQLDDLTALSSAPAVKALTPKYFSSELTGSGKGVGLLNKGVRPGSYPLGSSRATMSAADVTTKTKSTGSSVTKFTVPLHPLAQYSVEHNAAKGLSYAVPFDTDRFEVTAHATALDFDVFLDLTPQGLTLHKDESGDKIVKDLNILYRMEIYVLAKNSGSDRVRMVSTAPPKGQSAFGAGDEFTMARWSFAPLDDAQEFIKDATQWLAARAAGVFVDTDELAEWMTNYDVHERICRLAAVWEGEEVADLLSQHISDLFANGTPDSTTLNHLAIQLRYLETYNISLSAYRAIHTTINSVCAPDVANSLSKQNLNLLMSHTLEHLSTMKGQLSVPPAGQSTNWVMPAHFSAQQRAAISTPEPLTLVQAGAGTGKSTVILGRIQHLASQGVNPADIAVLSFTNAAADNITEKNPAVKSMTIARMIHDIYSLNHPTHELSSIDTILNSIEIYFPTSDIGRSFRKVMMEVDKLSAGSMTLLNAFVEKYQTEVLEMLNRIRQTCLELEIVIAYQQIDTMIEPPNVSSKFLIIDEVQDNSIFEFIYLLKYVAKHRENMFIVGDASQTLYEFRASNPKALNALEESGVFSTFQLTTNYRSNQEILDFANVHLADIEANLAAQLRLQANSLLVPTATSFREKVKLNYLHYQRLTEFRGDLPSHIAVDVRPYIEASLARGEQVAFLAYSRQEVAIIEEKLQQMFPQEAVANLVSSRVYPTTVFSQYIKLFWNDVLQVDPADAAFVIHKGINDNLAQLTRQADKAAGAVAKMTSEWWVASAPDINGWVGLYQHGQLSADAFFERLQENVLGYEIRHNGIKQSLMNQKNRERKEKNLNAKGKLVVSTIHGAKGLEFDNVVVVHKYDASMKEADKRMFYVAFTRAMKSMYVLSYGTVPKPRIESDYELIVGALEKRDALTTLRDQGVDTDALSDDEVEAAIAVMMAASSDASVEITITDDQATEALAGFTEAIARLEAEAEGETAGDGPNPLADASAFTAAAA